MIFVTGDTHGQIDSQKLYGYDHWAKGLTLTKADYLIVAGDFGFVWDKDELGHISVLDEMLPYTLLFIDGNHENFDLLKTYPIEIWNGGKIHKLSQNVMHLMRGQVFTIDGLKIFTMGGAVSIDKMFREEGISWWAEEVPSKEEFEEAYKNLDAVGNKVDLIITHTINATAMRQWPLCIYEYRIFGVDENLDNIEQTVDYKMWYFGHFHIDMQINGKKRALYNDVIAIRREEFDL